MIERVIGAFRNLGFDLDDKEIADILWLTVQMRRSQSSPLLQLQRILASSSQVSPTFPDLNQDSLELSTENEASADVHSEFSQDSNQISSGLPIKVPGAKALRNQLAISRSLKPLKRRIPSKREFILDETATAERIAQEKLLLPVIRPAPERWLELALVIDEAASMMLWKQTIKELKQLLERHGAFRDVRSWGLFISEDSKVWLSSRTGSVSRQKKLHDPKELIDPNGRRLFVIISDCVSPAWRNGTITKALAAWASTCPTTIIQVLPEWLWERSALGIADSILLRSLAPGVPNQQLIMTALDLLDESDVVNKLKVPVVTLEPESLKNWAWMVAGAPDVETKGFLLAPDAEIFDVSEESTEDYTAKLSAKQRLERFRLTASPMARKLAGLLAAAPISLPVVRLIRQKMLPQSSQVHVAEVFLGGILKPLSPIDEGVDADKIQYDFVDGVRDLLLDGVPLTKSTEVLHKVSEYVAQRVGLSVDEFTAMLVNPQLAVDSSMDIVVRPFAQITAKVLKRLGGEYAQFAEQIEENLEDTDFSRKPSNSNTSNANLTYKTNTDGLETVNLLPRNGSSRYRKIWRINPAGGNLGYEEIPLTIAQQFINSQLFDIENSNIQISLLSLFKSKNKQVDLIQRALAGLCLRCYVSEAILKECKKISSLFSGEKQFTYRDLLPFVLNDDGQKLIVLDEDGKTQLIVDENNQIKESKYKLFSVTVLQTFDADLQSPMSLDHWAYLQTRQNPELNKFLSEFGLVQVSDWALLNKIRVKQLERLLTRERHIVDAFHTVYRRDRQQGKNRVIKKCPDPTDAQLQEMLVYLQQHQVRVNTPQLLIEELKGIASKLRRYDIWNSRESLDIYDAESGSYVIRRDLPSSSLNEGDLEHQEILQFLQEHLYSSLTEAIRQEVEAHIQKLQKSKKYAPFAQKYIQGLQLYYSDGMSLKNIAPKLGMTGWEQARRVLNPGELLSKVRTKTVNQMLEIILKLAAEKGLTEIPATAGYLSTLTEQIESYIDGEIFQQAAEEIRTGKNRRMNSAYAEQLRNYISELLT